MEEKKSSMDKLFTRQIEFLSFTLSMDVILWMKSTYEVTDEGHGWSQSTIAHQIKKLYLQVTIHFTPIHQFCLHRQRIPQPSVL